MPRLGQDGDELGHGLGGCLQGETGGEGSQEGGNTTIRFDFRLSTPATSPPGQGAGGQTMVNEEPRVELKKFSLRPEKYDGKGDF